MNCEGSRHDIHTLLMLLKIQSFLHNLKKKLLVSATFYHLYMRFENNTRNVTKKKKGGGADF